MKTQLKAAMIITWMVVISSMITQAQPVASVTFQTFYNELRPYGTWMSYGDYGNVWMPNAGRDFRPYATAGYWAVTEYGNTWVSDYAWGWAPFHYGRWFYDDFYGWLWMPGNEWAPAWVAWRSGGGYYGWAPLGPRMNINITVAIPNHHWYFVPQRYICGPGVGRHFISSTRVVNVYRHTTIVNHVYEERNHRYFTGPSRQEIESRRGRRVEVYTVNRSERPGTTVVHNRSINMYRPSFDNDSRNDNRTTPSRRDDNYTRNNDRNDVIRSNDRDNNSRNNVIRSNDRDQNNMMRGNERNDNGPNNIIRSNDNERIRTTQQRTERTQPNITEQRNTNNFIKPQQRENNNANSAAFNRLENQNTERRQERTPSPSRQFQQQEPRQQSQQFSQPRNQRSSDRQQHVEQRSSQDRSGGRSRR